jgi:outer membrane protein
MKKIFLLIFITGIAATAQAQSPVKLSLNDAMDYSMKHNFSVKNAEIDVQIQQAQNNQVLANAYPHINGSGSFSDFVNLPVTFFPNSFLQAFAPKGVTLPPDGYSPISLVPKFASACTLTASQVVFDANVMIALQARNTIMQLAHQSKDVTLENIRYNIYKAYNSLVIAYRQFDIIKSSLIYARSIEHDINIIQQNGFAEKIDVERTTVQINNLATDSMKVQNLLTFSEQLLKYQIGMDINTPIVLTDTNLEERKRESAELLAEQKNYEKIPTYELLQTQLKLNDFNIKRFKLTAYPSLVAIGSMGYSYSANNFSDIAKFSQYPFNSMIGLQLNVPIYNGHLRIHQLKEAQLTREKTLNTIENFKQTIDFQVVSSKTTLQNVILQIRSQRNNMELADEVLALARKKYQAGVGSNMEVTQAQTDLLRAQNNYFGSLLDLVNAQADLKKALGFFR